MLMHGVFLLTQCIFACHFHEYIHFDAHLYLRFIFVNTDCWRTALQNSDKCGFLRMAAFWFSCCFGILNYEFAKFGFKCRFNLICPQSLVREPGEGALMILRIELEEGDLSGHLVTWSQTISFPLRPTPKSGYWEKTDTIGIWCIRKVPVAPAEYSGLGKKLVWRHPRNARCALNTPRMENGFACFPMWNSSEGMMFQRYRCAGSLYRGSIIPPSLSRIFHDLHLITEVASPEKVSLAHTGTPLNTQSPQYEDSNWHLCTGRGRCMYKINKITESCISEGCRCNT